MCQCLKIKKLWNSVVLKPENHNLTHKSTRKIKILFKRKKEKKFFVANTKLQVDKNKRNIIAKFNKPLFNWKPNIFKSPNDHNLSRKETRYITLEMLRKPFGPINSELWFEFFCSLFNKKKMEILKETDWLQFEIFLVCNSQTVDQNQPC